jgi:hypothetical protein
MLSEPSSRYLTDRIDPRKLLFFYDFLRGLSLFLLPSILFSTLHASTFVFVVFYGLDWVATVPANRGLSPNNFGARSWTNGLRLDLRCPSSRLDLSPLKVQLCCASTLETTQSPFISLESSVSQLLMSCFKLVNLHQRSRRR